MKKTIFSFQLLVFITLSATFSACKSKDLTREKASELIEAKLEEVHGVLAPSVGKFMLNNASDFKGSNLEKEGYGVTKPTTEYSVFGDYKSEIISLTEKSKPFLIGKSFQEQEQMTTLIYQGVINATCKLKEVTGIAYTSDDKSKAKVEFTFDYTLTPFGIYKKAISPHYFDKVSTQESCFMQLYDDGWRMDTQTTK